MLKLREFIKRIRACKTLDEERSLCNKESAEIRNLKKETAQKLAVRSMTKCMAMSLLGYQTEFIHMTCISLLASQNFTQKRLAYLGICMLLDEKSKNGKTYRELATLGLIKGAMSGNANNYRTILEIVGELTQLEEDKQKKELSKVEELLSRIEEEAKK